MTRRFDLDDKAYSAMYFAGSPLGDAIKAELTLAELVDYWDMMTAHQMKQVIVNSCARLWGWWFNGSNRHTSRVQYSMVVRKEL